ncbi:MAG: TaqI-like C-terminal specificity domain-containing protein [bacterium]
MINKAYLKANVIRVNFNKFSLSLNKLIQNINVNESEEHNKNIIKTFLEDSFYKNSNFINTKGRTDLVIHRDSKTTSPAIVMIEAKSPSNKSEMISYDNINKKAFHELVLYYLRERIENKNFEIKKLIITNAYEWYIFDASDFEKFFYNNSEFKKQFDSWNNSAFVDERTKTFYDFTENKLNEINEEIYCAHFDLRTYPSALGDRKEKTEDGRTHFVFAGHPSQEGNYTAVDSVEKDLLGLYKVFSPEFLMSKPFANDSNSLNKDFYYELLYIMGLEEVSNGGKKLIKRCSEKTRNEGSIIENIIRKLESENRIDNIKNAKEYGSTPEEQLFGIALQLALTWLNRILFMKLLESQLIRYNNGDKNYRFLDADRNTDFNGLNTLFFKVLNIREDDRYQNLKEKYDFLPYLNSSLFEITELEKDATDISGLEDNLTMPLYKRTVLKDVKGNRSKSELLTQEYLLRFLDAYDFGTTGAEEIVEEDKALINASVLGLVFEKINGYKDGSFFTPGFITMYMANESVRLATIQKFNDKFGWDLKEFSELYNQIDKIDIKDANAVIDDLKICDPAVGSGHFLVSVLNEIIAMKSELKIFIDKEGKRLRDYRITVINDELHIEDEEGKIFDYHVIEGDPFRGRRINPEKQIVQETIFEEKRKIIENCLFGVDINPNSVQICRLRLWIELLKSAYYTKTSHYKTMETLPNIDINIKCGNSLVSKYGFDQSTKIGDEATIARYKFAVDTYKNITDRGKKTELKKTIEEIKSGIKGHWHPENKERMKLAEELHRLNTEKDIFASEKDKERIEKKKEKLIEKIGKLKEEEAKSNGNGMYWNAFDWRFEFPEVLDDSGNFMGFDIVIGNPPYIQLQKNEGKLSGSPKFEDYKTFDRTGDIYCLFYERGFYILKNQGYLTFITSNKWMRAGYGENTRRFLAENTNPKILIDFGGLKVFDHATVDTNILIYEKAKNRKKCRAVLFRNDFQQDDDIKLYIQNNEINIKEYVDEKAWVISSKIENKIKSKIEKAGIQLKDWDFNINRGIITGYNEAFIIDRKVKDELVAKDSKSIDFIKPLLRGRDIKKYKTNIVNKWVIMIPKGFTIKTMLDIKKNIVSEPRPHYGYVEYDPAWEFFKENYPALANHLIKFKSQAEKRQDQGDYWWELRACAYLDEFENEKVVYNDICQNLTFSLVDSSIYFNNTAYFIPNSPYNKYFVAILNSKIIDWFYKKLSVQLGEKAVRMFSIYVEKIPIPKVKDSDLQLFQKLVDEILLKKDSNQSTLKEEKQIDLMVYKLYDLTYDEVKTIDPNFQPSKAEYEKYELEYLSEP